MNKLSKYKFFVPENDKNLQFSLNIVYIFAGIVHLFFLFAFINLGVVEMQIANYFSPMLYSVSFLLNRRGRLAIAATIGVSEAVFHGVLSLFYVGWEANFHIYIVLVYFLIFFIYKIKVLYRALFAIMVTALYSITYYYALHLGPKYELPQLFITLSGIANICFAGGVLSVFAITYSVFIRQNISLLEYAEKQQRTLNAQKNKFFSIISHDLKNPVTALDGFVGLMLKNFDKVDDPKKRKYLIQVHNSVNDLRKLVENLLEWSSSQLENIKVVPEKVQVSKVFIETKSLLDHQAFQKEISIDIECDESLWVRADLQMFKAILRNLVSNAVKFTPSQGKVKLNASHIGENVQIEVSDTGIGMPDDMLPGIFSLEKKNIRFGTDNEKGTGLGLVVVKEFVGKNFGSIEVISKEDEGTQFLVQLPAV